MPFAGYAQPLLEIPQNKNLRIGLAVNAWLGEPIINCASKLTIFLAFEKMFLTVASSWKTIPAWFPEDKLEYYVSKYGAENPDKIVAAYVKQECLELCENLGVKSFFEGEALDTLVAGDGFINIATNALPEEEAEVLNAPDKMSTMKAAELLKKKMLQDGRGSYKIDTLQSLNPSAVWLYPDYAGRITHAKIVHLLGEGIWDINLNNLIHLKSFSWNWTIYGVSHYISALKWIDIKFKMMDALYVNAQRYISPREWLKITGPSTPEGGSLPPTDQQMDYAEQILELYNQGTPHVLPGGWEWMYLGAEGKVLNMEGMMEKTDDAIRTAAQVSRTFTSGSANVPAYATSKLQAGIMYKAVDPLKTIVSRAIEGRILHRFCKFNGWFEEDGTVIAPKVEFKTLPIQGDDSVERMIETLGQFSLISPQTAWEFVGIDPALEMDRINMARQEMVEPFRAITPDYSPSQSPDRYDDTSDMETMIEEKLRLINSSRAKGHKKITDLITQIALNRQAGMDVITMEKELGKYLTQAAYLRKADARVRLDSTEEWEDQIRDTHEALVDPDRKEEVERSAVITDEVRSTSSWSRGGNGRITT